jgi:GNAT superfamily N-acetyltransferase
MQNTSQTFKLRAMKGNEWDEVAELIHESTNSWYITNGKKPIFTGPNTDARLFCEIYEALDPECCIIAECQETGKIAGSCFYHPRSTHVSLGIMNVHSDFFGQGVAGKILSWIIEYAEEKRLPVRLVSSAQNLDSFSLYTKKGFVPFLSFQDLLIEVPHNGLTRVNLTEKESIREAVPEDIDDMVDLEQKLVGIERAKDFSHFIKNSEGIWKTLVFRNRDEELLGFLSSVNHPASRMIGPGVARAENIITALLATQLDFFRGYSPVFLLPVDAAQTVKTAYSWGARNCEIHFAQCLGKTQIPRGVVMPTFMPETS